MKTISLVGSVSRKAGGLFESVRRLHQELLKSGSAGQAAADPLHPVARDKVRVSVVGLRDEFTSQDLPAWEPVPVQCVAVRGPRSIGFSPHLAELLRCGDPDLVHVHGLWQFNSIAMLQWHHWSKRPYIVSPHGMLDAWALNNSRWKKRITWLLYERAHLSRAACIRALCRAEVEAIRALRLNRPICLIPNGIDLPSSDDTGTGATLHVGANTLSQSTKVLLYLGRIHPKKGLLCLLRAWGSARPPADWILVIAGWDQGGHLREIERLSDELGIPRDDNSSRTVASLRIVGPQFGEEKKAWLRRCDAMILPSLSEGLPMAILEAWAHGKPTLISPQCNLSEGVQKGAAIGIEANEAGIANGLSQLFRTGRSEREDMGRRGRDLVEASFDWARIAEQLRDVYYWVKQGGVRPTCVVSA